MKSLSEIHLPEIIGGIVVFVYISSMVREISKKSLWQGSNDEKISKERSAQRGLIASTATSGIMFIIISLLQKFTELDQITTQAMISLLWGNTIGFLLDNTFATESALNNITKNGIVDTVQKSINSLNSRKFSRYLLIDTIVISISISLLPHVSTIFDKIFRSQLANKFSMTLSQSIISAMLFLAFTNTARFEWAYKDYDASDPRSILFVLVSLVVSIQMVNKSINEKGKGIESFEGAMIMLLFTVLLSIRELSTLEIDKNWLGLLSFAIITLVSFTSSVRNKILGFIIGCLVFLTVSSVYNQEFIYHSLLALGLIMFIPHHHRLAQKHLHQ